ncbi:MAG: phosphoribosylformylglycinamidine synthase subunit PurS [Phycisphaeraceae bacterium]|nr:phosphoribosylformylglycinamidine synthase subunit PurS [Phycisphaeraceae bacterium]
MPSSPPAPVHRIEVSPRPTHADPIADALKRDAAALGIALSSVRSAHVYLVQAALSAAQLETLRTRLLADPVTEIAILGSSPDLCVPGAQLIEVHPLPGVMDPVAQSVQDAIRDLSGVDARVSTGWRYDLAGDGLTTDSARRLAARLLANPVIHRIHTEPYHPETFPQGRSHEHAVRSIPLLNLSDEQLTRLSRDAHLFLSLDEMRAIQAHYTSLSRDPTDIELETLAQTWSEHCVHKTLKSSIHYRAAPATDDPITWINRPGHAVAADGTVTISNLLKSTVAAATHELIAPKGGVDWTLSVFVDNAGVIAFDDTTAVCVKIETHNHPSAIEPYGGAATGAGGCIRDVIGTGLAARPVANTDVFCVAFPDHWSEAAAVSSPSPQPSTARPALPLPPNTLHPRRVLSQVVAGVRDYGNRMGIPTVSGAVSFDDRYIGNPLVFCGCIGVMPRSLIKGAVGAGDLIVALGGRTGRDGIHGATFSSAELEHTSADEFAHAVQIGNAIEEKRLLDAIMRARDYAQPLSTKQTELDDVVARQMRDLGIRTYARLGMEHLNPGGYHEIIGADDGRLFSISAAGTTPPTDISKFIDLYSRRLKPVARWNRSGVAASAEPTPLFTALTDCGAGGFSSAIGEMAKDTGAIVHLDRAPLKYDGLSYTEIWISEAQERMVLAVPPANLEALKQICAEESVELAVLGEFRSPAPAPNAPASAGPDLQLLFHGQEVGRLSMHFLHDGIPTPHRDATWPPPHSPAPTPPRTSHPRPLSASLLDLLAHPSIASKHWIIRQYDHEVRGNTLVKPLVGPDSRGPSDASIIQPVPGSTRALAISQGLQTGIGDPSLRGDPYLMVLAAVDECVRNLVCVGADPTRIAILDNFCWPSCQKPHHLGALVRAAEGCYDAAKAYRTPFVSGKDSLNNQLTYTDPETGRSHTVEIPYTLLITGIATVPDVARCITMDAKRPGNLLLLVGATAPHMGGSHYQHLFGLPAAPGLSAAVPATDLTLGPRAALAVHALIRANLVRSAHDVSDGGLLAALAEMLIAGHTDAAPIGASIDLAKATVTAAPLNPIAVAFAESPSRYLIEIAAADLPAAAKILHDIPHAVIGELDDSGSLIVRGEPAPIPVTRLREAWTGTLDW